MKLVAEDLTTIKTKELEAKIEIIKRALEEQSEMHQAYVGALELEGKSAAEIEGENEGNEALEEAYGGELEKLEEYAVLGNLCQRNSKIQKSSSLWLKTSISGSATFSVDGNAHREELEALIGDMTPYKAIA